MLGIRTTIATRLKNCLSYELIQTDSAGLRIPVAEKIVLLVV